MKRRNQYNSRARVAEYEFALRLLTDFMAQVGGTPVADDYFARWDVATIFGPLRVTVGGGLNFVAARFAIIPDSRHPHIERLPAREQLNIYSGKWNCCAAKNGLLNFHESVLAFTDRLERIALNLPQEQT